MNEKETPRELTPTEMFMAEIINKSVEGKSGHKRLGKPRPPRKNKPEITENPGNLVEE